MTFDPTPRPITRPDLSGRVILDLCGGTGAWSRPYADAGYTVIIVNTPAYDVRKFRYDGKVYGILAAPPCTHFSLARSNASTPRNFAKGMDIVTACLRIIWNHASELEFWALENPRGYLRLFLGKPAATFQPWHYGAIYSKQTDLWGRFNMPPQTHFTKPDYQSKGGFGDILRDIPDALPAIPEGYEIPPDMANSRAVRRSITPTEFATAFYRANS